MPQPAVIFDLDGTLVDTLADIGHAMNYILEQFGLPGHDLDAYRYFVGDGIRQLVQRAVGEARADLHDAVLNAYRPYLIEHSADRADLYDGMADLLDALTGRAIPFAVLSNKPHDSVLAVQRQLLSRWDFAAVQGQVDGVPHKPDPTLALRVADELNTPPARCVFVGDTRIDMQTARNARMFAVGALWGFRDRAELEQHGADVVIDHPMQLIDVLPK
jgi:phosphoglycolate phosphatase